MRNDIEQYLSVTRGKGSFRSSQDEIADALVKRFDSTLKKHRISVVVIWSTFAKNEIVEKIDGSKTIIWDTNYWYHCACYHANLFRLNESDMNNVALVEIQGDALWRDLFRVAIYRAGNYDYKDRIFLAKYYLLYGTHSYSFPDNESYISFTEKELIVDLAIAKTYAFLHELAHVTSKEHMDDYINILRYALSDKAKEQVLNFQLDSDKSLNPIIKEMTKKSIERISNDVSNNSFDSSEEIIADMRALVSMCTCFMRTNPDNIPYGFTDYKNGIALLRSFNFRIWNITRYIDEIVYKKNLELTPDGLYDNNDVQSFLARDYLMEYLQPFVFQGIFVKKYSHSFLLHYEATSLFRSETIHYVNMLIPKHISKLFDKYISEKEFIDRIEENYLVDDVLTFLLYYQDEESYITSLNNPTKIFGFNGFPF